MVLETVKNKSVDYEYVGCGSEQISYSKKGKTSQPTSQPEEKKEQKQPVSGKSGKEAANDVPSWARGERPHVDENGNGFAKRLMNNKYGKGNYKTGPGTEYNSLRKWGDRGFK